MRGPHPASSGTGGKSPCAGGWAGAPASSRSRGRWLQVPACGQAEWPSGVLASAQASVLMGKPKKAFTL